MDPREQRTVIMAAHWAPDSWTRAEARQLPDYPDADALAAATETLRNYPPLVFAGEAIARRALPSSTRTTFATRSA